MSAPRPAKETSHIQFGAWGMVDLSTMDKHSRKMYLRAVRRNLKSNFKLEVGGNIKSPHYMLSYDGLRGNLYNGPDFSKMCREYLRVISENSPQL